jgi:TPR repeat protein
MPNTDEEIDQNYMNRVKANDPMAIFQMGNKCRREGDYEGAIQYYTKAAGLGDIDAHYNLSVAYHLGKGVEKDEKKELHHLEEAAIGGHTYARYNLGNHEGKGGRYERAAKHYIIAAKLGLDEALERVKEGFAEDLVSKGDFEAALRGHQAAVDATKSDQREEGYAFYSLPPEEQIL